MSTSGGGGGEGGGGDESNKYADSRPFPLVDFIARWRQRSRSGGTPDSSGSLSSQANLAMPGPPPDHCDTAAVFEPKRGAGVSGSRSNHGDFEPDSPLLRRTTHEEAGLVTNSILFCWLCKIMGVFQTHVPNKGLHL